MIGELIEVVAFFAIGAYAGYLAGTGVITQTQFLYLAAGMAAVMIGGVIIEWQMRSRIRKVEDRIEAVEARVSKTNEMHAEMLAMMRKGYPAALQRGRSVQPPGRGGP